MRICRDIFANYGRENGTSRVNYSFRVKGVLYGSFSKQGLP